MTAHELARKLLDGPDVLVFQPILPRYLHIASVGYLETAPVAPLTKPEGTWDNLNDLPEPERERRGARPGIVLLWML